MRITHSICLAALLSGLSACASNSLPVASNTMPAGIPVGTLAIGKAGAINAALLAASVLALHDKALADRLSAWRKKQTDAVAERPEESA